MNQLPGSKALAASAASLSTLGRCPCPAGVSAGGRAISPPAELLRAQQRSVFLENEKHFQTILFEATLLLYSPCRIQRERANAPRFATRSPLRFVFQPHFTLHHRF